MKQRARIVISAVALLVAVSAAQGQKRADLAVGLMPAYNSIPLIVAEDKGLFQAEGIAVDLEPFNGQLERETALQTGSIDGTVSDMINAIQSWSHGFGARVTSVSEGNFSLLSSPGGRIRTLADWPSAGGSRVKAGLLENSIVYYLTERMLSAAGADPRQLEIVPIAPLPARVEMLLAGKVEAACLPEPLATLAAARGAHVLADSDHMGTTPGVILFTKKALVEKRVQIIAFYKAYDAAVDEVNSRPDDYRKSIVAKCGFPPAVGGLMRIPRFHHAFLPPESLVTDVGSWMMSKGLAEKAPAFNEIVAADFTEDHARVQ